MYRIKTDIRQYKCESIDKVEKLIRNWVIRPNDLIYSSDERDWLPIGDHPSFEKLFGILEEREAAEPDTVVTDDHPLLRNGTPVRAEIDEATQLSERPEFEDDEESDHDESLDSRETDIFDADQIAESLAERDRAAADAQRATGDSEAETATKEADGPEVEDPDEAPAEDETNEDIEAELGAEPLAPPVAPEGVEPPVNDEITVMTDKTLEMMKVDDHSEAEEEATGDEATADEASSDESTSDEASSDEATLDEASSDEATPDEATQVTERPTDDEATQVTKRPTDDEATQVTERPTDDEATNVAAAPGDDDETEQKIIVAAPDEPGSSKASKGVGRHDLPEEFFATNEISGPVFEESARVIDDLAAMEAERTAADNVDDGWDEISEDFDSAPDDKPALGLRDTDEIAEGGGKTDGNEVEEDGEKGPASGDPASDEPASDEPASDEPFTEDAIAAADEWDEDISTVDSDSPHPIDTPETAIGEFISDGYKMPLPFKVGPDERDVALGLKRSSKSTAAKDAIFPYPKPKKRGEVDERIFHFIEEEPRDLSIPIVVGIVVICAVIATLAVC